MTYRVTTHCGDSDNLVTFAVPSAELELFRIAVDVHVFPLARLASTALRDGQYK